MRPCPLGPEYPKSNYLFGRSQQAKRENALSTRRALKRNQCAAMSSDTATSNRPPRAPLRGYVEALLMVVASTLIGLLIAQRWGTASVVLLAHGLRKRLRAGWRVLAVIEQLPPVST